MPIYTSSKLWRENIKNQSIKSTKDLSSPNKQLHNQTNLHSAAHNTEKLQAKTGKTLPQTRSS